MNYTELVAEISSYTENVFDTADINTFITQAEQRIYNSVQLPASRKIGFLTTVPATQTVSAPADFLAAYSLALITPGPSTYTYLLNKDPNFIWSAFPQPSVLGKPTHYGQLDASTFILGPNPDAAYDLTLFYFGYPTSITTANTSWLGNNFSSVLLYGALVEAYTFMKGEPDLLAAYDAKYKEALALLKQLADAKNRQDSYRTGQIRYPVT